MFTRRSLLAGSLSLAASHQAVAACGCAKRPVRPTGIVLLPPNDPRWNEARGILDDAPKGPTAYDVALYLSSIPWTYRHEWRDQKFANPLIVDLFGDLGLTSEGDTTSWCAAFANWCLFNVGQLGTKCAWAQSFRPWGTEVWTMGQPGLTERARVGDLAVFQRKSDPCQGHVAFVNGFQDAENIQVLGGNQFIVVGGEQVNSIDVKTLGIDAVFRLLTIRRAA